MIRRPPRSTQSRSSAASDVYKRQRLAARLRPRHRGDRAVDGSIPPREGYVREGPVGPALSADHLARSELSGDWPGPPRRRARLLRVELLLLAALPHPRDPRPKGLAVARRFPHHR